MPPHNAGSEGSHAQQIDRYRDELLQTHLALHELGVSVILIVSGVDGAGKAEVVFRLTEWLHPRWVETQAFWRVSDEERDRPYYWRFWRVLPGRGRIGIFLGSWYTEPIVQRVHGLWDDGDLNDALKRIVRFEQMLVDDGTLILKFALHLTKDEQRRRLKHLEENPETHWRVLPSDWKHHKLYDSFVRTAGHIIKRTDIPGAPWLMVDAADPERRDRMIARLVLGALQKKLREVQAAPRRERAKPIVIEGTQGRKPLEAVDLEQALSKDEYREKLSKYQRRLNRLTWAANEKNVGSVLVFEGWDAGGKGSAIRRVIQAVDPRLYRVIPVGAPNDEERARHYLWRFWRPLPREGFMAIYDRSWYGRVLVERVERFATPEEWGRAYDEINEFEGQLLDHGMAVAKFWLHISKDEQLRRFRKRQETSYKKYKITEEDWRNRRKWKQYEAAVDEMVARTSTRRAPWTLVAGNDKRFARIQILRTICDTLEKCL